MTGASTPTLRAGVARANLTPPVGIAHAGWGVQTHTRAAGIDLDLFGTALVLEQADEWVAIVDLDFGVLDAAIVREIRTAITALVGIPADHVRLSYTHTHSGPMLVRSWLHEGDEMVPAYVASLPHRIAGAVWQAQQVMQPVRVGAATGSCDINVNRRLRLESGRVVCGRNWDGFVDHEVVVVRIEDLAQRPVAVLVNYGAHPTIMGAPNQLVTPDYPGIVRQVVETAAPGALCLFLQGAAGNTHAIVDYVGDPAVYRRLGAILGHEASRLALQIHPVPTRERLVRVVESGAPLAMYADEPIGEPDGTLAIATRTLTINLKPLRAVADLEAEYLHHTTELARAREQADPQAIVDAAGSARRAHLYLEQGRHYAGKVHEEAELQAIRIGQVGLVGFPGEPFAEIGAAVKQRSPFTHTLFGGYTNGYLGYVPTDDARPLGGYEVESTPFGLGTADALVDASLALLRELWEAPHG